MRRSLTTLGIVIFYTFEALSLSRRVVLTCRTERRT